MASLFFPLCVPEIDPSCHQRAKGHKAAYPSGGVASTVKGTGQQGILKGETNKQQEQTECPWLLANIRSYGLWTIPAPPRREILGQQKTQTFSPGTNQILMRTPSSCFLRATVS